jgi:microcystin-dependent protein
MGSSFPHNNLMPYLTLNFCIALQGVFPPRS